MGKSWVEVPVPVPSVLNSQVSLRLSPSFSEEDHPGGWRRWPLRGWEAEPVSSKPQVPLVVLNSQVVVLLRPPLSNPRRGSPPGGKPWRGSRAWTGCWLGFIGGIRFQSNRPRFLFAGAASSRKNQGSAYPLQSVEDEETSWLSEEGFQQGLAWPPVPR